MAKKKKKEVKPEVAPEVDYDLGGPIVTDPTKHRWSKTRGFRK